MGMQCHNLVMDAIYPVSLPLIAKSFRDHFNLVTLFEHGLPYPSANWSFVKIKLQQIRFFGCIDSHTAQSGRNATESGEPRSDSRRPHFGAIGT
ncbi:hypothetical protein WS99_13795 [Burkholderia territorii]|nr:hypothetical protein WS99_13795 [Burkholderia territorii]